MKLVQHVKSHPWLFAGLSGLPLCLHSAFVVWIAFAPKMHSGSNAPEIPDNAWMAAFAAFGCLPILSGIVGVGVAWILSLGLARWTKFATRRLAKFYTACFVMGWVVVFGYLSFFTFAMGLGAPPAPTSLEQFVGRFEMVLIQFPIAIAISLAVCALGTGVVILVCESIAQTLSSRKM